MVVDVNTSKEKGSAHYIAKTQSKTHEIGENGV
jgi:hypothetical protein